MVPKQSWWGNDDCIASPSARNDKQGQTFRGMLDEVWVRLKPRDYMFWRNTKFEFLNSKQIQNHKYE